MLNLVLDVFLPQEACCICRKPGRYGSRHPWCCDCQDKMLAMQCACSCCDICGKYLENGAKLCKDCRENPPLFKIARAVGPYDESYRIATKVLKFMGRKYLAPCMGNMMAKRIQEEPRFMPIDLIVPVPISRGGLKQRGFNQTELLGKQISKKLDIRMDPEVICRVKDTPSQVELSREEREKNLLFAFKIKDSKKIYRKNVLLVDDVYTTGRTLFHAADVLRPYQPAMIRTISLAR